MIFHQQRKSLSAGKGEKASLHRKVMPGRNQIRWGGGSAIVPEVDAPGEPKEDGGL